MPRMAERIEAKKKESIGLMLKDIERL